MKKTLIKLAVTLALFGSACTANVANAQERKFDIMTYSVPQGYRTQNANGTKTFLRKNDASGKLSLIVLYPSTGSFGNSNTDFDRRWKQLITNQGYSKNAPKKSVSNGADYTAVTGYGTIQYEGGKALALLTTVTTKGRLITILGITNDESAPAEYESFVSKLDINTDSIASSAPQQTERPASGSAQTSTNQQLVGRWVTGSGYRAFDGAGGAVPNSTSSNGSGYSRDLTFQANGTFFDNGIVARARESNNKNCRNQSCKNGRYKVSDGIMTLTYLNGNVERSKFELGPNEYKETEIVLKLTDLKNGSVSNFHRPLN
jgi:hypothetical protein